MIAVRGVDDLAAAVGAEPSDQPWGRWFVIHDPDGNRIEFYDPEVSVSS